MPLSPIRKIHRLGLPPVGELVASRFKAAREGLDPAIDLNFPGVETQHATHGIHPYVAAINPPLASSLIRHYVPEGAVILDPFCGGGGVLVEAVLAKRKAVGCDVNPLAVLLSRVKTRYADSGQAEKLFRKAMAEAERAGPNLPTDDIPEVVKFWYLDSSLAPLKALRAAILKIEEDPIRELFQAALSATARDVMLTYRGEIRLRKLQGRDLARFQPDVFAAFRKRAVTAIARVGSLPKGCHAKVKWGDARQIGEAARCHTVITSPPYGDDKNGVGYFQFSRNMLYWIGVPLEELKAQKQSFLGGMANGVHGVPETPTLQRTLGIIKRQKDVHHREAASFYTDYFNALKRMASVTEERVIIIIGDRVLSRTEINNGHITTEFMGAISWDLERYYSRQIIKKRIANLGGDGGGIALEHIMVFRKR